VGSCSPALNAKEWREEEWGVKETGISIKRPLSATEREEERKGASGLPPSDGHIRQWTEEQQTERGGAGVEDRITSHKRNCLGEKEGGGKTPLRKNLKFFHSLEGK